DQFENLDKHTQWGIDFLERYAKFVKERLEIEQTYAKQLRNLVKKYCPKRSKDEEPSEIIEARCSETVAASSE
ncbi:formin-binding protein 1-like, partial [Arapaima gigas]